MYIYIKYTAFKKSAYAEILYHFNCLAFANTLNMIHLFVNNKHAPSLLKNFIQNFWKVPFFINNYIEP